MIEKYIVGTGAECVNYFDKYWSEPWRNPDIGAGKKVALLTICSHAKPYGKSHIHALIRKALHEAGELKNVHYIHLSSAGVVPEEVDCDVPFAAYDWNVAEATPFDIEYHIKKLTQRLSYWCVTVGPRYNKIVFYVRPDGHTRCAINNVVEHVPNAVVVEPEPLTTPLPYMRLHDVDDMLTSPCNTQKLIAAIKGT